MKKYEMGEIITSLDELAKQDSVYLFVRGGRNEHWKYQCHGWFVSFQFNYVINKLCKGDFRYAIKKESNNEKV
mgnify:CR=1 FL=1